jgi:uracil-DNA glycosylase
MKPLSQLLDDVRACTLCAESLPYGPRPVFQLHADARLLIVGQAPGRRVHETGIPFNDPSGQRLRAWLGITPAIFYDPMRVALLPMGLCYPGTHPKGGDLPPRFECAPTWRAELLARLPRVELTVVLGRYALAYHLPESKGKSVTESVRSWRRTWPEVVPLPHPSPRNILWVKRNSWFEEELLPDLRSRIAELLQLAST